jgi:hypothetical protein
VVGITSDSFRRDDLSREDQAGRVASEFGAYAYVGRHAGGRPQPLEQQAGAAAALDSQQVRGVCNATVPSLVVPKLSEFLLLSSEPRFWHMT